MRVLEPRDKNFPINLKKITPKVKKLFYKGNLSGNIFKRSLTVVGARKMTRYGERVIESLLPPLVEAGVTIISGFMYGVDQAAHKTALFYGGKTVAVLGWGIDWPVENTDKKLYSEIEKKGLIVSEYVSDRKPQLWMFPRRNRIMAGLSEGVLVIEAAENSGSLITAAFARKYNKHLLSVPGPVTSAVSIGTNKLIKSRQAKMVISADDIFVEMGWQKVTSEKPKETKDTFKDLIIQLLKNEPLTVDQIAISLQKPVEKISVRLSILQLKGLIEEKDDKYYSKIK